MTPVNNSFLNTNHWCGHGGAGQNDWQAIRRDYDAGGEEEGHILGRAGIGGLYFTVSIGDQNRNWGQYVKDHDKKGPPDTRIKEANPH